MAFFERKDVGRIYVIRMELPDGYIVHKIGMCNSNRSVDRMLEILRSWFMRFRFIPYCELKLDMECNCPKELEAHIHKILGHQQFHPHMKVDGGCEMFIGIDEFRVLHYLRTFNEDLAGRLNLTDKDYENLGQLISP